MNEWAGKSHPKGRKILAFPQHLMTGAVAPGVEVQVGDGFNLTSWKFAIFRSEFQNRLSKISIN
ncbi:hypothetical protein LP417_34950 (plasmid) [Polaromonas sp. P1-6]|nr:hypothetical protein LP417_34950 [Polaromonas sp. P1-6]